MKQKPLCTVILPTIGRPQYLPAALGSVAAQTYSPLNILLSDNAANPPLDREVVEGICGQSNLRLVRRETRLPPADHINRCIQEAEGEYVFLMSDDDILAPGYIAAGMECITQDAAVGIVVSKQELIDEHFLGPVQNSPIHSAVMPGNEFVARWVGPGDPSVATVFPMLVRREELIACGGFRDYPTASYCDTMIFFQLCLNRKLGLLDQGYFYRIYPTSSGLAAPWQELLKAQDRFEQDLIDLKRRGVLSKNLLAAILRSDTRLLVNRWLRLYRFRAGFENKILPPLHIAVRLASLFSRFGLSALPKLHTRTKS